MWNLFDVIYIGCKSLETRNFQLSLINFSFRYKIVESENIKVRVLIEVVRVRRIELITVKDDRYFQFTRRDAASHLLLPPHQQPHLSVENLHTVA